MGKPYGKAPAYRRDPLAGLSHGATAFQVARFDDPLDRGELVSPELTRQMKAALGDPGIRHKFVKGLESRPDTPIYRKSGTWCQFHSDSALAEGRRWRYILVGIAEDPRGGDWLEKMAAPLNDLADPGPSDPGARAMGRRGGRARAKRLSAERRRQIASLGYNVMQQRGLPLPDAAFTR